MTVILCAIGVIAAVAGACRLAGRRYRGRRRLLLESAPAFVWPPALVAAVVIFLSDTEKLADVLGVVGVVVAFVFGVAGDRLSPLTRRPLQVAVVIPSRDPFHVQIRRGFRRGTSELSIEIVDYYLDLRAGTEDISSFESLLDDAGRDRPDVLVAWPPGRAAGRGTVLERFCRALDAAGGRAIVLQNAPADDVPCTVVSHDFSTGTRLLADELLGTLSHDQHVLIALGPQYSGPAANQQEVWKDAFGKRPNTVLIQLSHWDTQECVDAVLTACQGVLPDVIVCPNDNCALALNDSLPSELRQQHPLRIVGYDGLDRMTAAIAEPEVSLGLTLRIPPDLFGRVAASVVREELRLFSPHRDRGRCERKVPTDLDGGYVMTTSRAFRRLYDGR